MHRHKQMWRIGIFPFSSSSPSTSLSGTQRCVVFSHISSKKKHLALVTKQRYSVSCAHWSPTPRIFTHISRRQRSNYGNQWRSRVRGKDVQSEACQQLMHPDKMDEKRDKVDEKREVAAPWE